MIWERGRNKNLVGNGTCDNDRWTITHPSNAASKRWELRDTCTRSWQGDWATLKEAKARAVLVEDREALSGRA